MAFLPGGVLRLDRVLLCYFKLLEELLVAFCDQVDTAWLTVLFAESLDGVQGLLLVLFLSLLLGGGLQDLGHASGLSDN